jgi:hypothetical protein
LDKCKVVINVKATTTFFCAICAMAQSTGLIARAASRAFRFLDMANQSAGSTMRNSGLGTFALLPVPALFPEIRRSVLINLEAGNSRGRSSFLEPVTKVLLLSADLGEHEEMYPLILLETLMIIIKFKAFVGGYRFPSPYARPTMPFRKVQRDGRTRRGDGRCSRTGAARSPRRRPVNDPQFGESR